MKLNKLPKDLEDKLPQIRDEWLAIGLNTDKADRKAAEESVELAYKAANLKPPKIKIWLNSPYEGAIAAAMLAGTKQAGAQVWDQVGDQVGAQVRDQVRAQVGAQVWDQVRAQVGAQVWDQVGAQLRDQVWDQIRDQVGAQLRDQVGAQVWDQVGDQLRDQVWDQVRAQVWAQLRDQLRDQLRAQVRAQVWDQVGAQLRAQVWRAVYGQHDAGWLAFCDTFGSIVDEVKQLKGLMQIAKSCGWWWPFENAVVFTERPKIVCIDQNKKLHCEDGPAIEYRDGFKIFAWQGIKVPAHWIEDKNNLNPNEVLRVENVEQRAAGCQIIGWHKMLEYLPHKILDTDPNPEHGELIEVSLEGLPEPEWYLRFHCPRNGMMMEGVNKREISEPTVFAAQAWKSPLPDHLFSYPNTRS